MVWPPRPQPFANIARASAATPSPPNPGYLQHRRLETAKRKKQDLLAASAVPCRSKKYLGRYVQRSTSGCWNKIAPISARARYTHQTSTYTSPIWPSLSLNGGGNQFLICFS